MSLQQPHLIGYTDALDELSGLRMYKAGYRQGQQRRPSQPQQSKGWKNRLPQQLPADNENVPFGPGVTTVRVRNIPEDYTFELLVRS